MHRTKKYKGMSCGTAIFLVFAIVCNMLLLEAAWTPLSKADHIHEFSSSLPAATPRPVLSGMYPDTVDGFLPLCAGKRTGQKIVALTIDDCNQADNLQEIIRIISDYGGKATIFPIGENISFLAPTLRKAVSKGFEIENHTQSHSGLFAQSDEAMAYEIWQQNYEVSQALGVDYQMHFLRPRGGDNRYDQRTHSYLRQMGYYDITYWSQEGSLSTVDEIMTALKQGDIILFHTTDYDLSVIQELVPRLTAAGYQMVTLNEMFSLPQNEQSPLTVNCTPMPPLPYERFDQILQKNDYLYDVFLLQKRLSELGYAVEKCDGCFGVLTEAAVKSFQSDAGLEVTGICNVATWNALFPETNGGT